MPFGRPELPEVMWTLSGASGSGAASGRQIRSRPAKTSASISVGASYRSGGISASRKAAGARSMSRSRCRSAGFAGLRTRHTRPEIRQPIRAAMASGRRGNRHATASPGAIRSANAAAVFCAMRNSSPYRSAPLRPTSATASGSCAAPRHSSSHSGVSENVSAPLRGSATLAPGRPQIASSFKGALGIAHSSGSASEMMATMSRTR